MFALIIFSNGTLCLNKGLQVEVIYGENVDQILFLLEWRNYHLITLFMESHNGIDIHFVSVKLKCSARCTFSL